MKLKPLPWPIGFCGFPQFTVVGVDAQSGPAAERQIEALPKQLSCKGGHIKRLYGDIKPDGVELIFKRFSNTLVIGIVVRYVEGQPQRAASFSRMPLRSCRSSHYSSNNERDRSGL